jgi:uncharacterized protein with HEPN domain
MRGEADDAAYLWDMLDAAKAALSFSEGINFEQYPMIESAISC